MRFGKPDPAMDRDVRPELFYPIQINPDRGIEKEGYL